MYNRQNEWQQKTKVLYYEQNCSSLTRYQTVHKEKTGKTSKFIMQTILITKYLSYRKYVQGYSASNKYGQDKRIS